MPRWWAAACDIRDQHAPQLLLEEAREHYGRLDILLNAGIQVGPVQNAQIGSYQSALDTMALSMVRMSLAALPVMRAQGRIVNITSIGGKVSIPHLSPTARPSSRRSGSPRACGTSLARAR